MDDHAAAAEERRPYHHGDLREALLGEAEALLEERGLAGFSLRAVAKRAGVSHAAPAHHFGDLKGLLTALAARGFERLVEAQERRRRGATDEAARVVSSGLGYVDFALAHPKLFELTFDAERLDWEDPAFRGASDRAYGRLADDTGGEDVDALRVAWSLAHGAATLLVRGHLVGLAALEPPERDAALTAMFRRALG